MNHGVWIFLLWLNSSAAHVADFRSAQYLLSYLINSRTLSWGPKYLAARRGIHIPAHPVSILYLWLNWSRLMRIHGWLHKVSEFCKTNRKDTGPLKIDHFWVTLHLCLKTSLREIVFLMKRSLISWKWTLHGTHFHVNGFARRIVYRPRGKQHLGNGLLVSANCFFNLLHKSIFAK